MVRAAAPSPKVDLLNKTNEDGNEMSFDLGDSLVSFMQFCQSHAYGGQPIATQADFYKLGAACFPTRLATEVKDLRAALKLLSKPLSELYEEILKIFKEIGKTAPADVMALVAELKKLEPRVIGVAQELIKVFSETKDNWGTIEKAYTSFKNIVSFLKSANVKDLKARCKPISALLKKLVKMELHCQAHPRTFVQELCSRRLRASSRAWTRAKIAHNVEDWVGHTVVPGVTAALVRAEQAAERHNPMTAIARPHTFENHAQNEARTNGMASNPKLFNLTRANDPLAANDVNPSQIFPRSQPSASNPLSRMYTFQNYRAGNAKDDFTYYLKPMFTRGENGLARLGERGDWVRDAQARQYVRDLFPTYQSLKDFYDKPITLGAYITPYEMQYSAIERLGLHPRNEFNGIGPNAANALINAAMGGVRRRGIPATRSVLRVPNTN